MIKLLIDLSIIIPRSEIFVKFYYRNLDHYMTSIPFRLVQNKFLTNNEKLFSSYKNQSALIFIRYEVIAYVWLGRLAIGAMQILWHKVHFQRPNFKEYISVSFQKEQ